MKTEIKLWKFYIPIYGLIKIDKLAETTYVGKYIILYVILQTLSILGVCAIVAELLHLIF